MQYINENRILSFLILLMNFRLFKNISSTVPLFVLLSASFIVCELLQEESQRMLAFFNERSCFKLFYDHFKVVVKSILFLMKVCSRYLSHIHKYIDNTRARFKLKVQSKARTHTWNAESHTYTHIHTHSHTLYHTHTFSKCNIKFFNHTHTHTHTHTTQMQSHILTQDILEIRRTSLVWGDTSLWVFLVFVTGVPTCFYSTTYGTIKSKRIH